jgi:hypothetical protein
MYVCLYLYLSYKIFYKKSEKWDISEYKSKLEHWKQTHILELKMMAQPYR